MALALVLALLLLLPAVGAPTDLLLQDTLKSALVAGFTLSAALAACLQGARQPAPARWHPVLVLPLALAAWALGSMAWSHAYLGGVEAVRWGLLALLAWLVMQQVTPATAPRLALAVHAGAVTAALWAALQFWFDWRFFAQGPNPAATFVNRNFFAEYAVCALPFSLWLLAQARGGRAIAGLAASTGLLLVAIGMTGTRSALAAMWLQLAGVTPLLAWRCRGQLAWGQWTGRQRGLAAAVLAATVLGLGSLPTGNAGIAQEGRGLTPLERAFHRTQSIRADDPSLGLRLQMWQATGRLVAAHPLAGVGAGAWEVEIPRFQPPGAQLETDYYVHNEFLQLVAEYGLVGWAFLAGLLGWLLRQAVRAWFDPTHAPLRITALASLLALLVVSQVGFPWRLAGTGALFAVGLGLLAGLAARPAAGGPASARAWRTGALLAGLGLAVAAVLTWRAAASERQLVQATRLALAISASGQPDDPRWGPARAELLERVAEGVALNPHYRKITPIVADHLASWGDWANATWIWESVLASRPHVVALRTNAARGRANLGDDAGARAHFLLAQAQQPDAPAVRSLEVVLLARSGQEAQALERARDAIDRGLADADLVMAAFTLGQRAGDADLVARARALATPAQRAAMAPPAGRERP